MLSFSNVDTNIIGKHAIEVYADLCVIKNKQYKTYVHVYIQQDWFHKNT